MCDRSNSPTALADRPVLLDDRAVLDGHEPATELDQPGAELAVGVGQGRDVDRRLERVGHRAGLGGGGAGGRDVGRRGARPRPGSGELGGRPRDEGALGLEGQHRRRGVEPDPADLVELVVVTGQVAADRVHQEVVDGLVDARAGLDEGVLDRIERSADPDLEPGLLLDLAQGGLLATLTGDRRPLGQRPGPAVALAATAPDDEPRCT